MGTYFRISGNNPQDSGMQKGKSLRTYVNLCAGEDHYLELFFFLVAVRPDAELWRSCETSLLARSGTTRNPSHHRNTFCVMIEEIYSSNKQSEMGGTDKLSTMR